MPFPPSCPYFTPALCVIPPNLSSFYEEMPFTIFHLPSPPPPGKYHRQHRQHRQHPTSCPFIFLYFIFDFLPSTPFTVPLFYNLLWRNTTCSANRCSPLALFHSLHYVMPSPSSHFFPVSCCPLYFALISSFSSHFSSPFMSFTSPHLLCLPSHLTFYVSLSFTPTFCVIDPARKSPVGNFKKCIEIDI